ncbi:orotidine-5'-phosphate decarboxylase [Candidatus Uhrbacteria bacterium]|nr:orotidine-5'-phosphate decarboxylase [Candidatus Uhrbacteria bacterium]
MELFNARWAEGKFVCVGLDSDYEKLPPHLKKEPDFEEDAIVDFNAEIIEATKDIVCAYKPNSAFYEALGTCGISVLKRTVDFIHEKAPEVPLILDAKRADIGNTNNGYVKFAFDWLGADAITVHPYLGKEALKPFLDRADKMIIVLARTSNPGAGEFQDLTISSPVKPVNPVKPALDSAILYQVVAKQVSEVWNSNGNCAIVAGATYPEELGIIRQLVGDMPLLIPGIGKQGGDLEKAVKNGRNAKKQGMIINNSSGVLFASSGPDFALAARAVAQKMHDDITQFNQS